MKTFTYCLVSQTKATIYHNTKADAIDVVASNECQALRRLERLGIPSDSVKCIGERKDKSPNLFLTGPAKLENTSRKVSFTLSSDAQ